MFGKTVEHEMKGLARLKIDNYILLLNYRVKCISYKHNEMILRNIILILVVGYVLQCNILNLMVIHNIHS